MTGSDGQRGVALTNCVALLDVDPALGTHLLPDQFRQARGACKVSVVGVPRRGGGGRRVRGQRGAVRWTGPRGGRAELQDHGLPPDRQLVDVRLRSGGLVPRVRLPRGRHLVRGRIDVAGSTDDRATAWAPGQGCTEWAGVTYGGISIMRITTCTDGEGCSGWKHVH